MRIDPQAMHRSMSKNDASSAPNVSSDEEDSVPVNTQRIGLVR